MNLLILGSEDLERVKSCMKYADENPIPFSIMMKMMNRTTKPIGDDPRHVVYLMRGYRVVYSLEHHGKQGALDGVVLFRHISISYNGKLPPFEAAQLILDTYQFKISLRSIVENVEMKVTEKDIVCYEDGGAISIIQMDNRNQSSSSA